MGYAGGMQGQSSYGGQQRPYVHPQSKANYKTELCKYFMQGSCPYEGKCSFAHGQAELREKQPMQQQQQPRNYNQDYDN